MSKFLLKFLAAAFIITAGVFVMSGGHAAAASNNCPGAPYGNWGNHSGHIGDMAAMEVHAYDGNDPNNQLNVNYTITSHLPGGNDKQIFLWDAGAGADDPPIVMTPKPLPRARTFRVTAVLSATAGASSDRALTARTVTVTCLIAVLAIPLPSII